MICLFEDKEDAFLSVFVRVEMQNQIKCFYSEGQSNLKKSLMSIHNAYPEEFVIVYCDLIPNNRNTKKTFCGLWDFIQRTHELHGKAFIAPSHCTEYYYLKSLEKYGLVDADCRDVVSLCMSLKPYLENGELSIWTRDEISTHEKLCKLLCKVAVKPCASTITKGNHHYVLSDCLCDTEFDSKCVEATVYEKSCRVADEW